MTVKTKSQLTAQITSLLADNFAGDISPQDVRTVHTDAVDSMYDEGQRSFALFERAGLSSKDDDLFPTLINKIDYEGVTLATRAINRNAGNNLIIDSIVDTYTFEGSIYEWTQTWLDVGDLLANRPGDTALIIT